MSTRSPFRPVRRDESVGAKETQPGPASIGVGGSAATTRPPLTPVSVSHGGSNVATPAASIKSSLGQRYTRPVNGNDEGKQSTIIRSRITSGTVPLAKSSIKHRVPSTSHRSEASIERPASRADSRPDSRASNTSSSANINVGRLAPAFAPASAQPDERIPQLDHVNSPHVTPVASSSNDEDHAHTLPAIDSRVLVCVRSRPVEDADTAWQIRSNSISSLTSTSALSNYSFDHVTLSTSNAEIYRATARPLVASAVAGYDAVIFAYGQTCSGKTYTLSGDNSNPGIIPQSVRDVFADIKNHPNMEFMITVSYIEIYNEVLRDLLVNEGEADGIPPKIRQDSETKKFFVSPLKHVLVSNAETCLEEIRKGNTNRHTACTDFNARSSRSHSIVQIAIEGRQFDPASRGGGEDGRRNHRPVTPGFSKYGSGFFNTDDDDRPVIKSTLSLIDLAGSEKATSEKERRVEGAFINKSLLTLEKVIKALTDNETSSANPANKPHIPYRDSKLTQILQPSLSGTSRVSVICTISPSARSTSETTSTLNFAKRIKKVRLDNVKKNEVVGERALIIRYEKTIAEMGKYIAQLEMHNATGTASAPSTPRQSDEAAEQFTALPGKAKKDNKEVAKAKSEREKMLGYIVNAGNIDNHNNDVEKDAGNQKAKVGLPMEMIMKHKAKDDRSELPFLQEKLLDAQDRIGELEEITQCQKDELDHLKAQLLRSASAVPTSTSSVNQELIAHNAALEKECRELKIILQNENHSMALKTEKRMITKEWSEKFYFLQKENEQLESVRDGLLRELEQERRKTERLEKAVLANERDNRESEAGLADESMFMAGIDAPLPMPSSKASLYDSPTRRRPNGNAPATPSSLRKMMAAQHARDGMSLLSMEAPMMDLSGSYLNLNEMAQGSPAITPLRSKLR